MSERSYISLMMKVTVFIATVVALSAAGGVGAFGPSTVPTRAARPTALAATAHHVVYKRTVDSIADVLEAAKENLVNLEVLAKKLEDLELRDPHVAEFESTYKSNDALKASVAEAKAAIDAFGPASPQAEMAWADVDAVVANDSEIAAISHPSYRYSAAALRSHHSYNAIVDAEMLKDSIQAVETILALDHFVQIEKARLHASASASTTSPA